GIAFHTEGRRASDIVLEFWRSGQVQYRRDLWQDDPHDERETIEEIMGRPIRSIVDIPFAYGTLALNSETPNAFGEGDLAFLMTIQGVLDESFRRLRDLQALNRKEEELRRAQKMEAIGHLAGGIAHDFNNMLTLVTGHASFLLEGLAIHDERRDEALAIHEAADRCAKMVQQLLAFSARQIAAPAPTDINAVIGESSKLLQRLIGENIKFDLDLDPAAGAIYIDRGQLEQIVLNLVINGRDAIGDNGAIRIAAANGAPADASPAAGYTVIAVTDTGKGMAPEVVEQIFDPFFTTKEPGQGTGLGLSTVYGIVRQNEGHIAVESTPGKGTTFRIYLPHSDAAAVAADDEPTRPQPGRETVLIVEDERALLRMARRQLERNGYTVLNAPDASGAFALLDDHPVIDLLLTDVVLARGPNGPELARQFRQRRPGVPVLFMSGYTTEHHEELEPGRFLPKPFTESMLTAMVRTAIDRA
ncbi:MAG: ATP-binding protein, partial [Alphaproteobacteria bacterium]|nr:ATP-binding protein [Alphaproteobacteria bacterium]